jgi:hypothetical protein
MDLTNSGATGTLGTEVVSELLSESDGTIYVLVRAIRTAADPHHHGVGKAHRQADHGLSIVPHDRLEQALFISEGEPIKKCYLCIL